MENEIIFFETEDKSIKLPVQVNADNVWLNRNRFFLLIAAVAFIVAAIAFLIAGIDQLNIVLVILAVVNAVLSGVTVYRYESSKKRR